MLDRIEGNTAKGPDDEQAIQNGHPDFIVMKFGGTSVADVAAWPAIAARLHDALGRGQQPVLVLSALGDSSDKLEALGQSAAVGDEYVAHLAEFLHMHEAFGDAMGLDCMDILARYETTLRTVLLKIRESKNASPPLRAALMAQGELLSTELLTAWLRQRLEQVVWLDIREYLKSDEDPHLGSRHLSYLNASCKFDHDPVMLAHVRAEPNAVFVTQGFIASNKAGETVLLGRGGSDTSAALIAARLKARRLEIWTDVAGIFSGDPRRVPDARLLNHLTWQEAQEIASSGASVLHPRALSPVKHAGIEVAVQSMRHPDYPGTLIGGARSNDAPNVKAIATRRNVVLVSMETSGMWHEVGFLAKAFQCFSDLGLSIDLVSTSESNVSVTLDLPADDLEDDVLQDLQNRLAAFCKVQILEDAAVVSLVGHRIRAILHQIGQALELFEEHPIHLISQASNDLNLSFVIDDAQLDRLVQRLHGQLISNNTTPGLFGPSWRSMREPKTKESDTFGAFHTQEQAPKWWQARRGELIDLARQNGCAYVYNLASVDAAAATLNRLRHVDACFYAVKANNNPAILERIFQAGLGFECVSPGEIQHILALFPDIARDRLLFTPNFAPHADYEMAIKIGAHITLDNMHPLRHWAQTFSGQDIVLRVDPGRGRGHHSKVITAGVGSKFGIPMGDLDEARTLAAEAGSRIVGLHAHVGSGILDAQAWADTGRQLLQLLPNFPDVTLLNLGGGLGVAETPGQSGLDLEQLDDDLAVIRDSGFSGKVWLEPGRFLVSDAGVLLALVSQTKSKGNFEYLGLTTGMNSLIRPALYGSWHEIVNLSKMDEPLTKSVTIVGPNCESGDKLGDSRPFPSSAEGDVILVANAGAYGRVMGSQYNMRPPAVELVLES